MPRTLFLQGVDGGNYSSRFPKKRGIVLNRLEKGSEVLHWKMKARNKEANRISLSRMSVESVGEGKKPQWEGGG